MRLPRLTYANVVATVALFVALGGTTVAATTISGKRIAKGTLPGKALKKATVTGAKVKPDALGGKQVRESALGQVPGAAVADRAGEAERAAVADEAATAGTAANADRVGGLTATQLRDDCPTGTQLYAGVCIETASRSSQTWPAAAEVCGDLGRRLPSLTELEGFRQEPGIALGASGEHTDDVVDHNGISEGVSTVVLYDSGYISTGAAYGASNAAFRCVAPLSNR